MISEYQIYHSFNKLAYLKEIAALERASFTNPWSFKSLGAEIVNPINLTTTISLRPKTEIIGYCLTRMILPEVELLRVAVWPEMRGRGVAAVMLNGLLQKLAALQVERVYLEVSEKNLPAIALYRQAGFVNINYRPDYYDNGTAGAFNLVLTLSDTSKK